MLANPEHEAAVALAAKIKAKKLSDPFTVRQIQRKGWAGLGCRSSAIPRIWLLLLQNPLIFTQNNHSPLYYIVVIKPRPPFPLYLPYSEWV
jgi:hypothetical protein